MSSERSNRKHIPQSQASAELPQSEHTLSAINAPGAVRTVTFDELAGGGREVLIQHLGQQYRLRTTRGGGLILNK